MPGNEVPENIHNFFEQNNSSQAHQFQVGGGNWPVLNNNPWVGTQMNGIPPTFNSKNYAPQTLDSEQGNDICGMESTRWKGKASAAIATSNPMSEIITRLQAYMSQSKAQAMLSCRDEAALLEATPELTDLLCRSCFGREITTTEKDKQWFQLGPEEAFYLHHSLKCFTITDTEDEHHTMSTSELWGYFVLRRPGFPEMYKAYEHLRAKNWVVRSGTQYGADFVAYRHHPALVHSEYAVLVLSEGSENAPG